MNDLTYNYGNTDLSPNKVIKFLLSLHEYNSGEIIIIKGV